MSILLSLVELLLWKCCRDTFPTLLFLLNEREVSIQYLISIKLASIIVANGAPGFRKCYYFPLHRFLRFCFPSLQLLQPKGNHVL